MQKRARCTSSTCRGSNNNKFDKAMVKEMVVVYAIANHCFVLDSDQAICARYGCANLRGP